MHTPALRIGTQYSLPAYLRDSSLSLSSFKHHLKTFLFSFYWASTRSAFGVLLRNNALYKFTVIIIIIFIRGSGRRSHPPP